jgi:hypothetical protein
MDLNEENQYLKKRVELFKTIIKELMNLLQTQSEIIISQGDK